MTASDLTSAVQQLSAQTQPLSDTDMGQPYRWRAHDEGVRFALIGTYHELRELALQLRQQRAEKGLPLTAAQQTSSTYHAAYRDLQAVLLGVDEETWHRRPGGNQWPLRVVVLHILNAERTFFALVHYTLQRQHSENELPEDLPSSIRKELFGDEEPFFELFEAGTKAEMMTLYDELHGRALETLVQIDDEGFQAPSLWWEGEVYPLLYRLHRFDAHLRQHTVQCEKVLAQLGHPPNEARRLLRLIYQALAEVESVLFGVEKLGPGQRRALADQIVTRTGEISTIVTDAMQLADAITAGEQERVEALLAGKQALANAINSQGVSLLLDALYRRQPEIAAAFVQAGATLSIMEGAALGRQDAVEAAVAEWPGWVNQYSADGFTPLQLACFFGHEEIARYLLQQGADVDAVARNEQQIQALHAAAAGPAGPLLVATLLEHGADPNARQQQGFTALHTAGQQGNVELVRLLLDHGADPALADDAGQTPAAMARAHGHNTVADLLEEPASNQPASQDVR